MKEVFSYCRDSILKSCNSSVRTHSNVYCKLIIVMFDMWSFNFLNLRKTSKILKGTPWKVFLGFVLSPCLYVQLVKINVCIACISMIFCFLMWEISVLKSPLLDYPPPPPLLWNELVESSYGWKTLFVRVSGAVYSSKLDNLGLNTTYSFPFMTRLFILVTIPSRF